MFCALKNKKGSSLPMVILIATVLVILSVVLGDSVLQSFRINRGQETVEYTYLAGEAAVERCFERLQADITQAAYIAGVTWSSDEQFATDIVNMINSTTDARGINIPKNYSIDVLGSSTNLAEVGLQISRAGTGDTSRTAGGMMLTFPIAVTATASLEHGIFSSNARKVYGEREFTVFLPNTFQLNGAIYSIGDVMASGGIAAVVKGAGGIGHVYAYGTAPIKKNTPNQRYYGGIYASGGSRMRIEGNAFTRAFVRAGRFSYGDRNSQVQITGDALAQSIQIFGNSARIFVGGNALTTDDLEVDGEDSVIAVNGSFIGLSRDAVNYADASSAIVNAAPIYYSYSQDSQKSRIVVNQDVIIGGSTYRVDPEYFTADFEMEDASFAWYDGALDNAPAYKVYNREDDYYNWLKSVSVNTHGYLNLFQVFSRLAAPDESSIDSLFSAIDSVRSTPGVNSGLTGVRSGISGFSNNAMAANSVPGLYFMDKSSKSGSGIGQIQYVTDSNNFNMDYLDVPENGSLWGNAAAAYDANSHLYSYTDEINRALDTLREKAIKHVSVFADRSFPSINNNGYLGEGIENYFAPCDRVVDGETSQGLFDYLRLCLDKRVDDSNINVIRVAGGSGDIDACQEQADRYAIRVDAEEVDFTHFLLINLNPDRDVVVNGLFNGIIFSTGRVRLTPGAYVNGAIVASGRGYDPHYGVKGSSAEYYASGKTRLPVIDEVVTDVSDLDSGAFAGVLFEGSTGSATVDFPGRESLLQKFSEEGIFLNTIF